MKLSAFLLLGLSLSMPMAQASDISLVVPFCDEAAIRLAPVKPKCIERKDEQIFDIPTLKINKDDLEKILQGAESSGGRIAPGNQMRNMSRGLNRFSTPFNYACEVKLLADGGKTLSWLSRTDFKITNYKPYASITRQDWEHGLIEGNDMDAEVTLIPLVEPQVALDNYSVTFKMKEGSKKVALELCQNKIESLENQTKGVCTTAKGTIRSRRLRANFSYKTTTTTPEFIYNQTLALDMECKRLHQ